MSIELKQGDAKMVLATMQSNSVQCCITSPPYWGLRDYGVNGQLGLEKTPDEYVAHLVEVMREVWRVLRDDGTLWLNLGDSYAGSGKCSGRTWEDGKIPNMSAKQHTNTGSLAVGRTPQLNGIKPKDLVGIPWMVAFALRADGWYLRSDIIWSKPNPMPESVTDRPTKAHEYVFLLSKGATYYYDSDAVREPLSEASIKRDQSPRGRRQNGGGSEISMRGIEYTTALGDMKCNAAGRNRRTVWTINTAPYKGAHFATFPPKLIEPMVLAGAPAGGFVLDPFAGSGTVGAVCVQHGRSFVGIELNPAYIELARERIAKAQARDPHYLRETGMSIGEIARLLKQSIPEVARQLK